MSSELLFPDLKETEGLLQDVLAFIDENISTDAASPGAQCPQKRSRVYSPDYERRRRAKTKAERESLQIQIERYEAQLELLRLQKPIHRAESKWSWVHVATEEEEKRRKAEELNYQLKGLLIQQLHGAQILGGLVMQQAEVAERIQCFITQFSPWPKATPLDTFTNIGAIAKHLKETLYRLRVSADSVFSLSALEMDDKGALMSSANLKYQDSIAESCIELRSSTPLTCSYESAVPLLWNMLVDKKVLGLHAECHTIKTKKLTQHSAEFGYSINNEVVDLPGNLHGVTIFEKTHDENRATLLWASMSVQQDGNPFSRCQGCLSVSRLSTNSPHKSVVRSSSRLCGKLFEVLSDSNHTSSPIAGKDLVASKSRLECAQMRIMERAEAQDI